MRVRFAFLAVAAVAAVAVGACSPGNEEASTVTTTPTSAAEPTTEPPTSEPLTTTTESAPAPQVITVMVAHGAATPTPTAPVEVKLGTTVVIEVTTDHADEVHVHGYEITQEAPANALTRVEVPATIPGEFEVELEHDKILLVRLRVQ